MDRPFSCANNKIKCLVYHNIKFSSEGQRRSNQVLLVIGTLPQAKFLDHLPNSSEYINSTYSRMSFVKSVLPDIFLRGRWIQNVTIQLVYHALFTGTVRGPVCNDNRLEGQPWYNDGICCHQIQRIYHTLFTGTTDLLPSNPTDRNVKFSGYNMLCCSKKFRCEWDLLWYVIFKWRTSLEGCIKAWWRPN